MNKNEIINLLATFIWLLACWVWYKKGVMDGYIKGHKDARELLSNFSSLSKEFEK